MRKGMKGLAAVCLAAAMALSMAGCGSGNTASSSGSGPASSANPSSGGGEPITLKITWWGSQSRHEYTQKLLDLYTKSHPNIKFEASPSGWDGYFDKLSTQTASGSMPDIVQMDYLYISTYAKNSSVTDLQPYIDDGTIDVSSIDEALLNTGKINGKMVGLVLSTSVLAFGYNPDVLAKAGVTEPTSKWTWDDFIAMNKTIKEKAGIADSAALCPVYDTNLFNYWVRQHGEKLFSEDNKSLGYKDDKLFVDYLKMWKGMMDSDIVPNPDEYEQIQTLGLEAGPVVTGDAAFTQNWNNYSTLAAKANDKLKIVTPPLADSDSKGLWLKPSMFFSVAETSRYKKEAAEFLNWFVNSEEANDIIMAERGTPASSKIRDYMVSSGKMTRQMKEMFQYVDDVKDLTGETPPPEPVGMSEVSKAFKDIAYSAFYGQATPEDAAANFRKQADEILARNN